MTFFWSTTLTTVLCLVGLVPAFNWDPGYPRMLRYPTQLSEDLAIQGQGAAWAVQNIRGSYQLSYWVGNQPNRHAKFQVLLLNLTNFRRFDAGLSYTCINFQNNQCMSAGMDVKSGQFVGNLFYPETLYFVVANQNFLSAANIHVELSVAPQGGPSWTPSRANPARRQGGPVSGKYE